ncbi:MAG: tetratricopeptide repeat protein [Thermoplasmata archaeon]|nr:MAG: tetratricopeptide repeat protein [Thermoplasmata archaeon]
MVGSYSDTDEYYHSTFSKYRTKRTIATLPSILELNVPTANDKETNNRDGHSYNRSEPEENNNSKRVKISVKKSESKKEVKPKIIEKEIQKGNDDFAMDYAEGLKQMDKGNFREAVKCFRNALTKDPHDRAARVFLIEALRAELNEDDKANGRKRKRPKSEYISFSQRLIELRRKHRESQGLEEDNGILPPAGDVNFIKNLSSKESQGLLDTDMHPSNWELDSNGFIDKSDFTTSLLKRKLTT